MSKSVEFYYDYGSATSYLAYKRLPKLCAEHDAQLIYKPVLLGGIFKATNNTPPGAVAAKGRYMLADMARFARRYKIPMKFNPYFPVNTLGLMRGAFAAIDLAVFERYNQAIFHAMWVAEKNLGELRALQEVLEQADLPAADLLEHAQTEDVKTRLKEATSEAVAHGLFGCPTMFVDEQMFFGQDRLDFVADALAQ